MTTHANGDAPATWSAGEWLSQAWQLPTPYAGDRQSCVSPTITSTHVPSSTGGVDGWMHGQAADPPPPAVFWPRTTTHDSDARRTTIGVLFLVTAGAIIIIQAEAEY